MQVLEHNEVPEVEVPELPAPQPGQLINIRVLMLTIKLQLTLQSNSLGRYVYSNQLTWQISALSN